MQNKQECIPVGYVPSAAVAVSRGVSAPGGGGGGVWSGEWGVCLGGVCLLPGVCLLLGAVWSGGCLVWGVSAPGGCLLQGGCLLWERCLLLGGVVSQHALRQTPPPPCGQTDACKNITFATSLRTLINLLTLKTSSYDRTCKTGPRGPSSSC